MSNFISFVASTAELAHGEKSQTQSLTHPAFTSEQVRSLFWLAMQDLIRRCWLYIFTQWCNKLSWGDILGAPTQCAGKYIMYTRNVATHLGKRYKQHKKKCEGKDRRLQLTSWCRLATAFWVIYTITALTDQHPTLSHSIRISIAVTNSQH